MLTFGVIELTLQGRTQDQVISIRSLLERRSDTATWTGHPRRNLRRRRWRTRRLRLLWRQAARWLRTRLKLDKYKTLVKHMLVDTTLADPNTRIVTRGNLTVYFRCPHPTIAEHICKHYTGTTACKVCRYVGTPSPPKGVIGERVGPCILLADGTGSTAAAHEAAGIDGTCHGCASYDATTQRRLKNERFTKYG